MHLLVDGGADAVVAVAVAEGTSTRAPAGPAAVVVVLYEADVDERRGVLGGVA